MESNHMKKGKTVGNCELGLFVSQNAARHIRDSSNGAKGFARNKQQAGVSLISPVEGSEHNTTIAE